MRKNNQENRVPVVDFYKFRGKELAIIDGRIAASGKTSKQALEKAKKLFPQKPTKDIVLFSVPKEKIFAYFFRD